MGIRTLCAAAAVVVGGAQAEAATYNVDFTITRAEHIYFPMGADEPIPTPLGEWMGLAPDTLMKGVLDIADNGWVTLVVSGVQMFGSNEIYDREPPDSVTWLQGLSSGFASLTWNGTNGSVGYAMDNLPDYYQADAIFEIAPVPLPATAALLPLGFGALALMRKRRRQVG